MQFRFESLNFYRRWRRSRLRSSPFPAEWGSILRKNVPLFEQLPLPLRREIEGHIKVLVHEKIFEGCGGLVLTDEIRVTIAANAALLLIGRRDYFPRLTSILVYPCTYVAPVTEYDGLLVTERNETRLGESWGDGTIVLAWDAARSQTSDPNAVHNVILHEFTHQLDTEDGKADGVPVLDHAGDYVAWARALAPEYQRLRSGKSDLDRYGAENPAEFFAVATEAFFKKPRQLRDKHPEIYEQLSRFYKLDLASNEFQPPAVSEQRE